jgi:hypothetical protein
MSHPTRKALGRGAVALSLAVALLAASASAVAQEPAKAPAARTAVGTPGASLDQTLTDLTQIQEDVALERARLELAQARMALEQTTRQVGGVVTGKTDIPELLGLSGTPRRLVAEFLVGNSIMHASEGQWVTADWKLGRVMSNGVELVKRGGRETHTLLFGAAPQRESIPGMPMPFSPGGVPMAPMPVSQ